MFDSHEIGVQCQISVRYPARVFSVSYQDIDGAFDAYSGQAATTLNSRTLSVSVEFRCGHIGGDIT